MARARSRRPAGFELREDEIIDIVRKRKRVHGIGAKEAAIITLGREVFRKHRVRRSTYAAAIELFGAQRRS